MIILSRKKAILFFSFMLLALLYALPNIFGEDPAVQISSLRGGSIDDALVQQVNACLDEKKLKRKSLKVENENIVVRFFEIEAQLQALNSLQELLDTNLYSIALNLVPVTPKWLKSLGAHPMPLGLDLRGGIRFLMEVDIDGNLMRRRDALFNEVKERLKKEDIKARKSKIIGQKIILNFASSEQRDKAHNILRLTNQYELHNIDIGEWGLQIDLSPGEVIEFRNSIMESTLTTMRNRVNELGVSEAVVQRQGANRIAVELPGIQDTARARDILGKTATLDFVMVDEAHDAHEALVGNIPIGSRLLFHRRGGKVLVKKQVILTGEFITGASSGLSSDDGKPEVSVRLGGSGVNLFIETTRKNVGKQMAVIYRESKFVNSNENGVMTRKKVTTEEVISVATIIQALGNNFRITGLNLQEARDLALLLRAGALPATISIVEEQIIGPSMGKQNIHMGVISAVSGLSLVLIFMVLYYGFFGLIANIALVFNLILLVAVMSALGATLTLPGIAGIVLTLGMAVDANVLIFERIREELRSGLTPLASIYRGFEQAFGTILDANITTLIVGVILFAVGTGPVKGFAITISIGILTSLLTAVTGTKALVAIFYRGRAGKKLSIGV